MRKFFAFTSRLSTLQFSGQDWGRSLIFAMIIGLAAIAYQSFGPSGSSRLSTSLLLSGASLLSGTFLGFLFGIPRALQSGGGTPHNPEAEVKTPAVDNTTTPRVRDEYRPNTNLEQISDWLTKILVGVGLTQLNKIPEFFDRAGSYFGPSVGSPEDGPKIAVLIIIYFCACGFLLGYLWTRIFLGGELARAENTALNAVVQQFQDLREEQSQIDAKAISMTYQWLDSPKDVQFSEKQMKEAIQGASAPVRVQIFYQAEAVRTSSWQNFEDKPKLEWTVPIFEALIASDGAERFHANYAQLGYALKNMRKPDYRKAEAALSKAIEIRGPVSEYGRAFYELNRAICRIHLDNITSGTEASPPEALKLILDDIKVAKSEHPRYVTGDHADPIIKDWMEKNHIS